MVKGVNRQVIIVKSPDPKLFDEAIFLVREDAFAAPGATPEQVIRQAQQAADGYLRKHTILGRAAARFSAPAWSALGALGASLVWTAVLLLF